MKSNDNENTTFIKFCKLGTNARARARVCVCD